MNTASAEAVCPPGPFDLAFCRAFLIYQPNPAVTLRKIAALVRHGGHVVAQDTLDDPSYPTFDPPVPVAERVVRLFLDVIWRRGGTPDVVRRFGGICDEAGLRLTSQRGIFQAGDAHWWLDYLRDTLLGLRSSLVEHRLCTEGEIETFARELESAKGTSFRSNFGVLHVQMIAEVS